MLLGALSLAAWAVAAEAFPMYQHTSSNFFGVDVGSYAVPFCVDIDGDGDMDCLVGDYDGYVSLFENTGKSSSGAISWSRAFTNFFSNDVGTYAAPFCIDLDNDDKMDCLVGKNDGYVVHFRRDAFSWTRVSTNFFSYAVGAYAKPFCADMDGDGDIDCIVGRSDGYVHFMRRESGSKMNFTQQSTRFFGSRDFGVEARPFCADFDGNGYLDCLVGNSDGYVAYMQGSSDGTWVMQSDNIFNRDFGSYAAPYCADFQGDGHLECVVGDSNGYAQHVEQIRLPVFRSEGGFLPDVGTYAVPSFHDMDGDGDLDCLVGEFRGNVEYYRNGGSITQFTRVPADFIYSSEGGGYAAPACFDTDGDGDVDCLVGVPGGTVYHYRRESSSSSFTRTSTNFFSSDVGSYAVPFCMANMEAGFNMTCLVGASDGFVRHFRMVTGATTWAPVNTDFFGLDVGSYAVPACIDLDKDGHLDCLVGENSGKVHHFRNTTAGWVRASSDFFGKDFGTRAAPHCADVDGDGLIECIVGVSDGTTSLMRQRDPGLFFTREVAFLLSNVGTFAKPTCADMDDDGQVDCLVGKPDGYVYFYRNDGSSPVSFTLSLTNVFSSDVGTEAAPFCYDIDGDGDKDCLVGTGNGYVYHFRNDRYSWTRVSTDFFSRDIGSSATPFCVDMDADGDLDCLAGEADGKVTYWRRDEDSWTYVTSDFFGVDVGADAIPFCGDLDGDGDVDCLVGQNYGFVYFFRNLGNASSHRWGLTTTNFFDFDVGLSAAPFCFDFDADGDLDCLVGNSNGIVYSFKNQKRTLAGGCPLGQHRIDSDCIHCAPGRYGTSGNGAGSCTACPSGRFSAAGSTACKQLITGWLSTIKGAVKLTSSHDGFGVVKLRMTTPAIPDSHTLYGDPVVAYSADVQATPTALSWNSSCSARWHMHSGYMEVSLPYSQLSGDCTMSATAQATAIKRSGRVALFVRIKSDNDRVVRTLSFPVELLFPRQIANVFSLYTLSDVDMPLHSKLLAPFSSTLGIYGTQAFATALLVPIFQVGQSIFVQHAIPGADAGLTITLSRVLLSTSVDITDSSAIQANLTDAAVTLTAPAKSVRFRITAVACPDCVLHVISKLDVPPANPPRRLSASDADRRLATSFSFARTSIALSILQPHATTMTEIRGTLDLSLSDAAAFAGDPNVQHGVAEGLRTLLNLPAEARISVGLAVVARRRRLQGAEAIARALSAGTVRVTYSILVPTAGLPDGRSPDAVKAALAAAPVVDVQRAVREGVDAQAGQGTYTLSVVSNAQPAPPVPVQVLPGQEQPLVAPQAAVGQQDAAAGGSPIIFIAAGGACGAALLVGIAVSCLFRRRIRSCIASLGRRKPQPALASAVPAPPPAASPEGPRRLSDADLDPAPPVTEQPLRTVSIAPSLSPIADTGILGHLSKLFTPPEETRKSMGYGRDVSRHHRKYTNLVVKRAWAVNMPLQETYYLAKRMEITGQLKKVDQGSAPGKKRTAPTPLLTDEVGVNFNTDPMCNEKLLLHGTKVRNVEVILNNGIDERYSTGGAFGNGAYFAEDPSKIDQYVDADRGSEAADEASKHLHSVLYKEADHPGEVFYAFVCQAFLGCPIYTKGPAAPGHPTSVPGPTETSEAGIPVFVNAETRRQLINIPGTFPPIPYHSLVVEKGEGSAVIRHREFVLFDGKAVLPKYLVAYARE